MKEVSRVQSKRAQAYQKLVERLSPKSDMAKGIFRAYWVGGAICVLGQLINDLFSYGLKWGMQSASTATSICLNLPHMRIPLLPLSYARRAAKCLYPPMPSSRTISPTSTELPMP